MLRSGFSSQSEGLRVEESDFAELSEEGSRFSEVPGVLEEDCGFAGEGVGLCFALDASKPGGGPGSRLLLSSTVVKRRAP